MDIYTKATNRIASTRNLVSDIVDGRESIGGGREESQSGFKVGGNSGALVITPKDVQGAL